MKYIGPTKTKPSKRNTAKESWQLLSCSKTRYVLWLLFLKIKFGLNKVNLAVISFFVNCLFKNRYLPHNLTIHENDTTSKKVWLLRNFSVSLRFLVVKEHRNAEKYAQKSQNFSQFLSKRSMNKNDKKWIWKKKSLKSLKGSRK